MILPRTCLAYRSFGPAEGVHAFRKAGETAHSVFGACEDACEDELMRCRFRSDRRCEATRVRVVDRVKSVSGGAKFPFAHARLALSLHKIIKYRSKEDISCTDSPSDLSKPVLTCWILRELRSRTRFSSKSTLSIFVGHDNLPVLVADVESLIYERG